LCRCYCIALFYYSSLSLINSVYISIEGSYPPAEGSEHINHDELSVGKGTNIGTPEPAVFNPINDSATTDFETSPSSIKSNSYKYKNKRYYSGIVSPMHESSPQSVSRSVSSREMLNSNNIQYRMDQQNSIADNSSSLPAHMAEPL
jgi:hypothetical protein